MTTEEDFLQAITADIDDSMTRLVFADWLEEQGDPRAEWVRLEGELAAPDLEEGHRATLEERKRVLWEMYHDGLIGWERRFALARIQAKIARLNPNHTFLEMLRAFGRPTQPEPTLSEARLLAFEAEYRVTLPEEYRLFLREVGNGGLGPGTGMPRLSDAVDRSPSLDLATPFPFSLRQYREDPERFSQERRTERYQPWPGVLYLAAPRGDWGEAYLVISGEDRGMVWGYGPINCGWTPECPTTEEDNRWEHGVLRGFFRWYEDWLDMLLTPQNRPG